MYAKLFNSILDSSVWLEDLPTRILWITMLAMADEHGIVRASIGGLAKRAGISREECEAGLAKFLAPDPDSRTPAHEGRRIEKVEGGWFVLNHGKYREIRTGKQRADADRQARHREKLKQRDDGVTSVTVTDVTTTASASASEGDVALTKQQPARREETDPLANVLAEAGLDLSGFTDGDRAVIEGMLRSSKAPLARAVVLANTLKASTPAIVGRAFREFVASEQAWNTRLFGGFVRDAGKQIQVGENRERTAREATHIDREAVEREAAAREEAETNELLADFERTHGEEFERLKAQAETMVPKHISASWRGPMVKAALVKLIRDRGAK